MTELCAAPPPELSEDYCRCGHVASRHADGEGECTTCRAAARRSWIQLARCSRFSWAETWEPVSRSA